MYYENYSKFRDEKNLTDYRVADDVGISRSTLSEWKNGELTPSLKTLKKISEYLGKSLDDLTKEG